MIVVDTSVWIDWFQNKQTPQVATLSDINDLSDVIIGDIILLEILQESGTKDGRRRSRAG